MPVDSPKSFMAPPVTTHTYTLNGRTVDKATYDKESAAFDTAHGFTTSTPQVGPAPVTNASYAPAQAPQIVNAPASTFNPAKDSQSAYANMASPINNISMAFTPNILDYYDVYTYHWKLFMVPMSASASGTVLNTAIQSIIAESGVSDLTIDKVEVSCIATPSVESGCGTMTNVKFEIVEPSGAGLLDKIFYETISLGLGNWMTSPFYLQLEFRGRDPETEASVINGVDGGIGQMRWVWPVTISKSKINVTHVGTRYEFEAVLYDEKAQANAYSSLLHSVTLKNLAKFKDAMVDLEKKLNEDAYEQLIDNYSIPDTFKIIVDPILAKIDLVNPDYKKNTQRASDWVDLSKKSATFTQGTSVDKIVDSLLGSTSLGQELVQDSKTPAAKPNTPQESKDQMKKLWRVVTETKPIAYDAQRQNNANAITIYVVQYDLGNLQADAAQTGQTPDTIPAMKKRLDEYLKKKILRKKYNYIFTGLNDQIIKLDLDMNYAFATATARFGGIYVDSAAGSTKGITQEENQDNEKKAGEIIRNTLKFINDSPPGTNVDAKIAQAKKSIAATKVSPEVAAKYAAILDHSRPGQKQAYGKELAAGGGLNQKGTVGTAGQTDPLTGKPYKPLTMSSLASSTQGNQGKLNFVSDVDISSPAAQSARSTAEASGRGKLRPIPTQVAPQEGNFKGIDPAADSGRAKTSSMFAAALYSGQGADLQSIKMTIKGDPFWLFPRSLSRDATSLVYKSNMADADAIAEIKNVPPGDDATVNILGTDNFIVIRFRTPRIFNDTTGSIDPFTESEAFSGIYKMTRVISKFENGKFSQELEAILDPLIDFGSLPEFLRLLSTLEATNKDLQSTSIPAPPAIPVTATKTEKLAGTASNPPGVDTTKHVSPTTKTSTSNIPSNSGLTATQRIGQQLPQKSSP